VLRPRRVCRSESLRRAPTGRQDGAGDRGRIDGIPALLSSEFLESGLYSDAPAAARPTARLSGTPGTLGAFKTATLRGVPDTGPYGHGGAFPTLRAMIDNDSNGGLPPSDERAVGTTEPWVEFPRFRGQSNYAARGRTCNRSSNSIGDRYPIEECIRWTL
jgi:hypothetical protein